MKYRIYSAVLAACLLLTGCSSNDKKPEINIAMEDLITLGTTATPSTGSVLPQESMAADKPVSVSSASASKVQIPTAEVTTTPDADSDFSIFYSEVHEQFDLSEDELSFVDYSLFVGDSICSGFSEYGVIPREHVAAKGNLGSRSFFDYTFSSRGTADQTYEEVLTSSQPRYVLLSMGMNDVNMVSEQTYCENYRKIIQTTLDKSGADVFVAAITPICSTFCSNSVIDSFNDSMRSFIEEEFPERVHFLDFGQYLKNDDGNLRSCLHSGDGVHLSPYCYYIALWEMHRALMEAGLWDGTAPTDGAEPMPSVEATTASGTDDVPTGEAETAASKPEQTSKPAKTTKPSQTTKPAKTTKATQKTTKPNTTKTTAEPVPAEPIEKETAEAMAEIQSEEPEPETVEMPIE